MRCSSILVNGNPDEIEKIINVIKSENKIGTEIINCCPSILAKGKASTIKAIIELFKEEKLDINLINLYPYILAQGTEKNIKIVIKELKLHDINFEKLYKTPLTKIFLQPDFTSMLCNPYSSNYNKNDYFLALKSYLILKNKYPDYYTKKEIERLCREKNISYEDFITYFFKTNNLNYINELLKKQKIFIGIMPMSKEQLERYGSFIVNISKKTSAQINKQIFNNSNYMIDDIEGFIINLLMKKSGGMFHNYQSNIKYLENILKKYAMKSALIFLKYQISWSLDYKKDNNDKLYLIDEYVYNQTKDDQYKQSAKEILDSISFSQEELQLLKMMDNQLESDDEIKFSNLSKELSLSEEYVLSLIKTIQNKILEKNKSKIYDHILK